MKFKSIILAAGKGTRMKSKYPKVIHKVCGKEMVNHVVDTSKKSGVEETIVVLGHGAEAVRERLSDDIITVMQTEQLGTAHAVRMAEEYIEDEDTIVVLCGDTPLIKEDTLKKLFEYHVENNCHTTVLSTIVEDPTGYGRIIRDENGDLLKIVEQKDASEEEKLVKEINSGIYCFNGKSLKEALKEINNDNAQGEYYLPDAIKVMRDKSLKVGAFAGSSIEELMGVNSRLQLSQAEKAMRKRINEFHMANGVTMIDPDTTYIEADVEIGNDTIVYPGVNLVGKTKIGSDCIIGMNSSITDSIVGDGTEIKISTLLEAKVGENTKVGPYAYLRPKADVGNGCKVGDFVEIKNAKFGDGSKASHLSYIGDAEVGKNVNVGCGVVFVNYDGVHKFRSVVKDNAFIGSNSNLVAPVTVEEQGYIATGSTITDNVPRRSLAIARQRQCIKENWMDKKEARDKKLSEEKAKNKK